MQDIEAYIKKANVSETEIKERTMLVVKTYLGQEENYIDHLKAPKNSSKNKNN